MDEDGGVLQDNEDGGGLQRAGSEVTEWKSL